MNGSRNTRNSKRVTDIVRLEVIDVLMNSEGIIEFNDIFLQVCDNMKSKNLSTGGEEILRLRIYEKLQALVSEGGIRKKGKEYDPTPKLVQIKANSEPPPPPSIY